MASITEIQGTDSLSSSRITLNNNFNALNDELLDIIDILNPIDASISGVNSISTETAQVVSGGTQIAVFNSSTASFGVEAIFNESVFMSGSIIKSGLLGTSAAPHNAITNGITSISFGTVIVGTNFSLPNGVDGQEVTIVNGAAGSVSMTNTSNVGATLVTLPSKNATITFRFFGSNWYIVSHVGANVTLA